MGAGCVVASSTKWALSPVVGDAAGYAGMVRSGTGFFLAIGGRRVAPFASVCRRPPTHKTTAGRTWQAVVKMMARLVGAALDRKYAGGCDLCAQSPLPLGEVGLSGPGEGNCMIERWATLPIPKKRFCFRLTLAKFTSAIRDWIAGHDRPLSRRAK